MKLNRNQNHDEMSFMLNSSQFKVRNIKIKINIYIYVLKNAKYN